MESAQIIFEQFKSRGILRVNEAIDSNEAEGTYLDYKEFRSRVSGESDENGWKQTLGKAASAFANSQGGVILWGVEAKNNEPFERKAIEGLNSTIQLLNDAVDSILDPPLQGIESIAIPDKTNGNSGYIATYIPKSKRKPHMSSVKGHYRYYQRVGSNSLHMDHDAVRAFILSRARPELRLVPSDVQFTVKGINPISMRLSVVLRNYGEVIAEQVALMRPFDIGSLELVDRCGCSSETQYQTTEIFGNKEHCMLMTLPPQRVIYPGVSIRFCEFKATFGHPIHLPVIDIEYSIHARDYSETLRLEVPRNELKKRLDEELKGQSYKWADYQIDST